MAVPVVTRTTLRAPSMVHGPWNAREPPVVEEGPGLGSGGRGCGASSTLAHEPRQYTSCFACGGHIPALRSRVMRRVVSRQRMHAGEELIKRSMWETAKIHGKDALVRAGSYAKGFAAFGAVYSTSECAIEKFRAKHDIYNSGYAGCLTGGILALKRCVLRGGQVGPSLFSSRTGTVLTRHGCGGFIRRALGKGKAGFPRYCRTHGVRATVGWHAVVPQRWREAARCVAPSRWRSSIFCRTAERCAAVQALVESRLVLDTTRSSGVCGFPQYSNASLLGLVASRPRQHIAYRGSFIVSTLALALALVPFF
jgi:hypothetical protein